ncbi:unnamed protein product [Rotaria magnacalcarata]|uniref:Uncharacterized protein n=1 Tax=Rotaria magnacalcarata TaxID=392030 RepID=A0A817A7S8_9BILA|nr:unnamed protein product [Rotaria magnacalcarata]
MDAYPNLETFLSIYRPSCLSSIDELIVIFHYQLINKGFRVLSQNETHEMLNLDKLDNSIRMSYVKYGIEIHTIHDTVDKVYSAYMQVDGRVFLKEFCSDDYINFDNACQCFSINIPGFAERSTEVINQLDAFLQAKSTYNAQNNGNGVQYHARSYHHQPHYQQHNREQ